MMRRNLEEGGGDLLPMAIVNAVPPPADGDGEGAEEPKNRRRAEGSDFK